MSNTSEVTWAAAASESSRYSWSTGGAIDKRTLVEPIARLLSGRQKAAQAQGASPYSPLIFVGIKPNLSGVSISPYVFLMGRLLRNLLRVQTSELISAVWICDMPDVASSWTT